MQRRAGRDWALAAGPGLYQQVSAGRHLTGQVVTLRLHPTLLQVFFAGQLIRTVPRTTTKEVVQLRSQRPTTNWGVSTFTRNQTRKHQPELDTTQTL